MVLLSYVGNNSLCCLMNANWCCFGLVAVDWWIFCVAWVYHKSMLMLVVHDVDVSGRDGIQFLRWFVLSIVFKLLCGNLGILNDGMFCSVVGAV